MRIEYLLDIIKLFLNRLSSFRNQFSKADKKKGKLFLKQEKGIYRFYHRISSTDTTGKYLPLSEIDTIKSLAQQEYEAEVIKQTDNAILNLQKCLIILNDCQDPDDVYENLPAVRRNLVIKTSPTTVDIEKWKDRGDYRKLGFDWNDKYIVAKNGLRVRSKTEEIIVNIFEELGIPYIYELLMEIEDEWIYPDFHVLNVRTGKEYIYEHCGKMDDPGYVERNLLRKLELYAKKNIFLGDNLLITFETNSHPLNEQYLRQFIKKFFL